MAILFSKYLLNLSVFLRLYLHYHKLSTDSYNSLLIHHPTSSVCPCLVSNGLDNAAYEDPQHLIFKKSVFLLWVCEPAGQMCFRLEQQG